MLDDLPDDRTPWIADVLVGSSNTDYNNKLGSKTIMKQMAPLLEVGGHSYLDNH